MSLLVYYHCGCSDNVTFTKTMVLGTIGKGFCRSRHTNTMCDVMREVLDHVQWCWKTMLNVPFNKWKSSNGCVEWGCGRERGWINSTCLIWPHRDTWRVSVGQKRRVQQTRGQRRVRLQGVERETEFWIERDACHVLIGAPDSYHFKHWTSIISL